MAFQRRGSRQLIPGRSARIKDWGLGPSILGGSLSSTGKLLWATGTAPSQNLTVIRTRGLVQVVLTASDIAAGGFAGAHGIYMMTEDAFAVGVTAALDPLTDANSDMWLWHSFFDVRSITATIADGVNAFGVVSRIEIDSKAMRKGFDPERVMVGVTGVNEFGVAVAQITADCRQLFLS